MAAGKHSASSGRASRRLTQAPWGDFRTGLSGMEAVTIDRMAAVLREIRPKGPAGGSPPAPAPAPAPKNQAVGRFRVQKATVKTVVTLFGLVLISFVVYQLYVTSLTTARVQRNLAAKMAGMLTVAKAKLDTTPPGEDPNLGLARIPVGEPVAVLRIPTIDVERVVVEGTGSAQTEDGPGHYRSSSLPGWPGNSVILGRRSTYSHPFRDLHELDKGDDIIVTTLQGRFVYKVDRVGVLSKGDVDVTARELPAQPQLTLATSHPPYRSSERLVVQATLEGAPVPPAEGWERPTDVRPDESGVDRDSRAWAGVLLWGELLLLAVGAAAVLYRRFPPWTVWLLTTPVVIALSFLAFESVTRLLPSTL